MFEEFFTAIENHANTAIYLAGVLWIYGMLRSSHVNIHNHNHKKDKE